MWLTSIFKLKVFEHSTSKIRISSHLHPYDSTLIPVRFMMIRHCPSMSEYENALGICWTIYSICRVGLNGTRYQRQVESVSDSGTLWVPGRESRMHPYWNFHALSPAYERAKPRLRKGGKIQAYFRKHSCLYLTESILGLLQVYSIHLISWSWYPPPFFLKHIPQCLSWGSDVLIGYCGIFNQSSCLSLSNPENVGVSSARYCSTSSYSDVSADTQFLALSLMKSWKLPDQLITHIRSGHEPKRLGILEKKRKKTHFQILGSKRSKGAIQAYIQHALSSFWSISFSPVWLWAVSIGIRLSGWARKVGNRCTLDGGDKVWTTTLCLAYSCSISLARVLEYLHLLRKCLMLSHPWL